MDSTTKLRLLASMFDEKTYAKTEGVYVRTVVGENGMFTDARPNATLIAVEPTILLSLDYSKFERFLLAFPESTLKLFKQRVQKFMSQQQVIMTRDSIKKAGA